MWREHFFPWRLWTWWNARLDARKNLPSQDVKALSRVEQQIQSATNSSLSRVARDFGRKAERLESELGRLRTALANIHHPEYQRLVAKTGRHDVQTSINGVTEVFLLVLLAGAEFAFNLVAFNVFGEPALHTAIMAFGVALAIPLCAWGIGMWVRQWPPPWWKTAIKVSIVTAAALAVLYGINEVRLAYLEEKAPDFLKTHPYMSLAFFTVNLVILVAAILVTYFSHDPEVGFEKAKTKFERCLYGISRIEGQLDQWATEFESEIEMFKQGGWSLMAYYRSINERHRKAPAPNYFNDGADSLYHPEFLKVREVGQYHGGATKLSASQAGPLPAASTPNPSGSRST